MKSIGLLLKGIIIGIGKIIPGVSGGTLAITMGLYEKGIEAISCFFKNVKENSKFLIPIGFGILIAVVLGSKIVQYFLSHYYLPTMLLFIGLILGGIPAILKQTEYFKKPSNLVIYIISFLLVSSLALLNVESNYQVYEIVTLHNFFPLFLIGIIDAATMIIPGISGTAILMILGFYNIIINALSNLTNFSNLGPSIIVLFPFATGIIVGVIIISKIISFLFKKYHNQTYIAITGFTTASLLILFIQTLGGTYTPFQVTLGFILLLLGYSIVRKMEN